MTDLSWTQLAGIAAAIYASGLFFLGQILAKDLHEHPEKASEQYADRRLDWILAGLGPLWLLVVIGRMAILHAPIIPGGRKLRELAGIH